MITNKQTKKEMLSTVTSSISSSKLIANSTIKYYDDKGVMYVRYHNTDIIIDNGKTTRLYTGGWRTMTTKERLNKYGPINVYQEKGEWFVCTGRYWDKDAITTPFYEGIEIDNATGNVKEHMTDELQAEIDAREERIRLNKLIKKYCKIVKDMGTLPDPGPGDCWICLMRNEKLKSWDELHGDTSHLISHLEEEYVHGSLLWNALKWAGYRPDVYLDRVCGSSWARDTIVRCVRRYLRVKLGFAS